VLSIVFEKAFPMFPNLTARLSCWGTESAGKNGDQHSLKAH